MPSDFVNKGRAAAAAVIPGLAFVALACGGGSTPADEPAPASPTPAAQQAATVVPARSTPAPPAPQPTARTTPSDTTTSSNRTAPTPAPSTFSADYDPTANLYMLFSGPGQTVPLTLQALENARREGDKSQAPAILEMMPFFPSSDVVNAATETLVSLTGVDLGGIARQWHVWMEWLGKNDEEFQPPEGYLEWKISIYRLISPRYEKFLGQSDKPPRVNLWELAWGGVRPDGIPDLNHAPVVPGQNQEYLQPDDRVFGVTINGESRAYPLRIVNAHEMANDTLGGEPISLAY